MFKNTHLKILVGSLIFISFLVSTRISNAQIIVDPAPSFDPQVFKERAEEIFGGITKGYSMAIVRNDVLVGTAAGGIAVDIADAPFPVPIDVSIPTNVGSTVKMVSAVALLSFFEKDLTASVDEWLDRKIINYFPKLWRETLLASADPWHKAVDQVTFRHILQHKSGLSVRDCKECKISHQFLTGVNPNAVGVTRKYSNSNLKILSYILPYIVDPAFGKTVNDKVVSEGITDPFDSIFEESLATYFGQYMQSNIFDKVSIRVSPDVKLPTGLWKERLVPSCDHKKSYAGTPFFRNKTWGISGDIPLSGDVDGDGKNDLVIWRPSTGQWFAQSTSGTTIFRELDWGHEGDHPLISDVNGDGKDDLIIWRPSNGHWFAMDALGKIIVRDFPWGHQGDIPFVGDVNGDGKADFIVWRPSTGEWFAHNLIGGVIARNIHWGRTGDIPLVGDINGNGTVDFVVWRPALGSWFAREADGEIIVRNLVWGIQDDIPLVGDINGNGADEFVIFRPSNGRWFARKGNGEKEILFRDVRWGNTAVRGAGLITPLLSDLSGNGKDNLVLFRQSNGNWSAAGRRYALGYASKDDLNPGDPPENLAEPPGCYAQGGYWFSVAEYAAWAATFGFGDTFVSQPIRSMMFDPTSSTSRDNRLGWASIVDVQGVADFSFIMSEFGIRYLLAHDGADPNSGHKSYFLQLPQGFYGFFSTNTREISVSQMRSGLIRAWIAAMGGN